MKIAIMGLLIVTIAALSHFAVAQRRYVRWRQSLPMDGTVNFPSFVVTRSPHDVDLNLRYRYRRRHILRHRIALGAAH
jgi:hypothetical protein